MPFERSRSLRTAAGVAVWMNHEADSTGLCLLCQHKALRSTLWRWAAGREAVPLFTTYGRVLDLAVDADYVYILFDDHIERAPNRMSAVAPVTERRPPYYHVDSTRRRGMPNVADVSHVVQGLLSDLRVITKNADQIVPRARFIARKVPAIREGLKTIGKSDKSEAISIGTFLENNARERPNAPALFFEDRVITHREFSELSNRYANLLAAHGVRKGDAVAILVDNRPELLIAVSGVVKLGAIAAVINTKQRKKVLHHSFSLCDASAYIIGEDLWDAFCEVKGDLPNTAAEKVFWVADGDDTSCPGDCTDIGPELEKQSAATPAQLADVTFGDPCFYIYTSGTTGLPKASIMSHGRWIKASGAFGKLALNMRAEDVLYVPLPYYHNNALTVA